MLQFFLVALVSSDLASSLRFYAEVFGYRHAGSQGSWGSKIQGLGQEACHRYFGWT
jgi:catechol 2,3-dioxygenase-like lactoylglutathione lyase family enzyme